MDFHGHNKHYWRSSPNGKRIAGFYLERSNRMPARMSRLPKTTVTPISIGAKSDCTISLTFSCWIATRKAKISTANPMNEIKPPSAILRRCFCVKWDIASFSHQ